MLAMGIVEKVNSQYSLKVRIPILHRASSDVNATPTDMLPDATIATFSRSMPNYRVGTVVVVGFDRNDLTSPVVIGEMLVDKESDLLPDVYAGTLKVETNCNLPSDTYIGDIHYNKIKMLSNARANIQAQLDDLESRIESLEKSQ